MTATPSPANSGGKTMLLAGLVTLLFALIFIALGLHFLKEEKRFDTEGITAPGVITSKRVHEKRERDRETKREKITTTYYLTYAFTTDQGKQIETENSVSQSRWQKSAEKDNIQVQYLPTEPSKSRIAGESNRLKTLVFTGISGVAGIIGIGCIVTHFRRRTALAGS